MKRRMRLYEAEHAPQARFICQRHTSFLSSIHRHGMHRVLLDGIDFCIAAILQHNAALDDLMPVAFAQRINGSLKLLLVNAPCLVAHEIELDRFVVTGEHAAGEADAAIGQGVCKALGKQRHGRAGELIGQVGRPAQHQLMRSRDQIRRSGGDGNAPGAETALAQARGDGFGEQIVDASRIVQGDQVVRRGGTVADGLDTAVMIDAHHGRSVLAVGEGLEHQAVLAQHAAKHAAVAAGETADRCDPKPGELAGRARADIEQLLHGQIPDALPEMLRRQRGDRVRLFHVAAQLGEDLVIRYADGYRDAQLLANPLADFLGDLHAVRECEACLREVNPVFIQPEGLHPGGILLVDAAHFAAEAHVEIEIRRHADQLRAFLLRLPDGFAGFDAVSLGDRVLGQDDAVARLHAAADGHGLIADLRRIQAFDGGIIAVCVAMQDHPVQFCHLILQIRTNVLVL